MIIDELKARLFNAVRARDLDDLKHLVGQGADVNVADKFGVTLLHRAVGRNGHASIVEFLASKGADVNAVDDGDVTPLHYAAMHDNIAIVKSLVAMGADVSARDSVGATPLLWAASHGHVAIVEFLVSRGADANPANQDGNTPLMFAVSNGHVAVVEFLKGLKAHDVQSTDSALRREAILAMLNWDVDIRARLGIRAGSQFSDGYDVERLIDFATARQAARDPGLRDDVEAAIRFHIETMVVLETDAATSPALSAM